MADDVVLLELTDRVATVTLNRPAARNALDTATRHGLRAAMARLDADEGVDVVILTGADPAFCAGLDLRELRGGGNDLRAGADGSADRRHLPFTPLSTPLIGAVNGPAVTGGLEIALLCDFLIASERAAFADTHARVGVQPGWGLTVLLPQAIGVRRAREMSVTGNHVDAPTAERWGLVNRVVPHGELLATCRRLAADIVSNDRAGVGRILRTYAEGSEATGADAWRIEAAASAAWIREGGASPGEVEARRAALVARGRSQRR